jgi:hypothetical protein
MPRTLRRAAVRVVKPRVSEETWAKLREINPQLRKQRGPTEVQRTNAPGRNAANKQPLGQRARLRPSLESLAIQYGTDTWVMHHYASRYECHFKDLRRARFTLLEIGIGGDRPDGTGGASLHVWKHFFPDAQVIGLDLLDKSSLNENRIITYQGSQTDGDLLRSIVKKHRRLKIVIDDGSHRPEHTRATFAILFPLLSDGGFYAIEATQASYSPRFGGSLDLKDSATTIGMIKDLLDGLNYEEFGDLKPRCYADSHVVAVHSYPNLVIIEKGRNVSAPPRPVSGLLPDLT